MRTESTSRWRRMRAWGYLGSGLVHTLTLAVIIGGQLWLQLDAAPQSQVASRIVLEGGFLPWRAPTPEPQPVQVVEPDDPENAAPSERVVQEKVNESVQQAQGLTFQEQLEQLKRRSAELNRVSSAESIDKMAKHLNALLGTKPRAERPAEEPVAGEFDINTAQLHDVRREPLEMGGYRYHTVLVDAAGRRLETEVDAVTGEQLFKVFEIIRGNPLLEKVYRQVVMGLLDKLIANPTAGQSAPGP